MTASMGLPSQSAKRWVANCTRSSGSTKLTRPPVSRLRAARNSSAEAKGSGMGAGRGMKPQMLPRRGAQLQFLPDGARRKVETDRAVRFRVEELVHEGVGGVQHFRGRAVAGDHAVR